MKKGETGEGLVTRVMFPDKAEVITEEGERVLVKYGLPGQTLRFRVTKKRKDRLEGQLLEVLQSSPEEIPADCELLESLDLLDLLHINHKGSLILYLHLWSYISLK